MREHARASVKTEIWLGHDGIFTRSPGELRDLSEGGAFVQVSQRFPIGALVNLRFQLPESRTYINGMVSVRNHRSESGMGVQFVDLAEDDRARVRDFVARFGGSSSW